MYFKVFSIATLLAIGCLCASGTNTNDAARFDRPPLEIGADPIPQDTLVLLIRYSANYWAVTYSEMEKMYQLGLLTICPSPCGCEWLVTNRGLDCITILGADIGI